MNKASKVLAPVADAGRDTVRAHGLRVFVIFAPRVVPNEAICRREPRMFLETFMGSFRISLFLVQPVTFWGVPMRRLRICHKLPKFFTWRQTRSAKTPISLFRHWHWTLSPLLGATCNQSHANAKCFSVLLCYPADLVCTCFDHFMLFWEWGWARERKKKKKWDLSRQRTRFGHTNVCLIRAWFCEKNVPIIRFACIFGIFEQFQKILKHSGFTLSFFELYQGFSGFQRI